MAEAYFAAGCFWCITPVYDSTPGVLSVVSGYSGGTEENPTYEDVKHQLTGHRETIRIRYDPEKVNFAALVDIFLKHTDPFDPDGQFIDRGHSYTLAIYPRNEEEKPIAEAKLRDLAQSSGQPVCVALEPFTSFWMAEEYHQDYYKKNPEAFAEEMISSGRIKQE